MEKATIYFYLNGELKPEEATEVERWIKSNPEEFNRIKLIWEKSALNNRYEKPDLVAAWNKINPDKNTGENKTVVLSAGHMKRIMQIAAVLLIAISLGIGYFEIVQKENEKWIEFASGNDRSHKIILPDNTKVYLNANSVLRYPKKFKHKTREIYLAGEALFEVTENKDKPFIIHTGTTITKVLGTSFNIYTNKTSDNVTVTVIHGCVSFYDENNPGQQVILEKGEQGIFIKYDNLVIKEEKPNENFLAWKTNILVFHDTPLSEVCKTLGKHYNTPVYVQQTQLLQQNLTARFQNKTLSEAISIMEHTLDITAVHTETGIELVGNKINLTR